MDEKNSAIEQIEFRDAFESKPPAADLAHVMEALSRLYQGGDDLIEVRLLDGYAFAGAEHKRKAAAGWYYEQGNIGRDVSSIDAFCEGKWFACLNPVIGEMHAIAPEQIKKTDMTSADIHIKIRRWAFLDFDPVRVKGFEKFSATDSEKARALALAREVTAWLALMGFDQCVLADSGNGYHVLYPIEMQNDDATTTLLKQWLEALARKFKNDKVEIDTVVFNAARLTKLYGTVSRKGPHSMVRPHRVSRLLEFPELEEGEWYTSVPAEAFRRVIDDIGETAPVKGARHGKSAGTWGVGDAAVSRDLDIEKFLAEHQIEHFPVQARPGGGSMWPLAQCPFNPDHGPRDAAVFKSDEGVLGFKCFHNSCSEHNWRHFRAHIDPTYDPEAAARREAAIAGGDIYAALAAHYEFRRNLISSAIEFTEAGADDWRRAEDSDYNTMKIEARRVWGLEKTTVTDVMEWANSDNSPAYHPIRDWLGALEWDKHDHIGALAAMVQTDDDELFRTYLRSWFVRAADQAVTGRANEYMIVLAGDQGVGKTTFVSAWLPPYARLNYYHVGKLPAGADGQALLTSKMLILDDELIGMRRTDVESIKAVLSSSHQTYRPPYGRSAITRPRLASFVGCTNEAEFLTDPTGSRRFLTITMLGGDLPAIREFDATGCWAQAMSLFNAGEKGYLPASLAAQQAAMNKQRTEQTIWDHYVEQYVQSSSAISTWANTTELAHKILFEVDAAHRRESLSGPAVSTGRVALNQAAVRELGRALRAAGYTQDTHGTRRWKVAVVDVHDRGFKQMVGEEEGKASTPSPVASAPLSDDDDDFIPDFGADTSY